MENILVSIRVRPLSKPEAAKGTPWKLTPKSIALANGVSSAGQTYNFDRVFDPNSKTIDIYDTHTKKIISSAVKGFNGTIFAYGQTSSGKTYTMRGTSDEPGIIPLAIQDVFWNTELLAQNREFLVRVSYMEIYNEEIKDLLAPENCKLQIHENFERGIFVAGLREEVVACPAQVLALMDFGEAHRHVGETNMNVHSSRSHAILRMVIESRDRSQDHNDPEDGEILQNSDPVRVSHLNLVDLAGSERVAKTGAEGARLKEGTHINKSLMTLGNVINKLSEGIEKQGGHIPYRDSKLTRILQPALGGNARTVIICNITPALVHVDESKGTLHFASRANRVTNCAQVNEIVTDAALLKRQKKEIAELRQKLQNQESPFELFEDEILDLRNELLKTELERERMALELHEFQKAQAERECRIKEQEQKIENLSTMVINSAVDDREFEKRSRRNNRRETWCARPQSGLPLLPHLKRSCQKEVLKTASFELSSQVNRDRSFGLPPPFEALTEEEEDIFTRGTTSSLDEGFHERLRIDDGFPLPEPGPQSSVADRRKRSSNDWIVGNELEQQLLDLQGQYDTLQCNHVIKMNGKESEIDRLKRELAYAQLNLSKADEKVQDPERTGKSQDSWKESESMAMIKQLRAQVGKLETEKLYMERELKRLSDQAREHTEISRQELEEVYEELNLAKETSTKLNYQLNTALQDVQQLQMEKRENKVLYPQMSLAQKDLKTKLDDIGEPCGGLQSSIVESLQHLTIYVKSCQECLAGTKNLSALGHMVHGKTNAKLPLLTSKADSLEDHNWASQQYSELDETCCCNMGKEASSEVVRISPDQHRMKLDEDSVARQDVQLLPWRLEDKLYQSDYDKESHVDEIGRTTESERQKELRSTEHKNCDKNHCYSASVEQMPILSVDFNTPQEERDILVSAVDSCLMQIKCTSLEGQTIKVKKAAPHKKLDNLKTCLKVMEDGKRSLSETNLKGENITRLAAVESLHMLMDHTSLEKETLLLRETALQEGLDSLKTCLRVMDGKKSSLSETNLQEERITLLGAVDSSHMQIECAYLEKRTVLPRKASLQEELDNLTACVPVMEDEKRILSKTNLNPVDRRAIEFQPGQSPNGLQFPEFEVVFQGHVAEQWIPADESFTSLEVEFTKLKEANIRLSASLANAHSESERAAVEQRTSVRRESALVDEVKSFKVALQSVAEERKECMKASDEAAAELGRLETVVENLAIKLAAGFEKFDRHYEISELSGPNATMFVMEGKVDLAIDELEYACQCIETLLIAVKQLASEEGRLLLREAVLSEELHHAKLSLESLEDEKNSLTRRLRETQSEFESMISEIDTSARSSPSSIDVTNKHDEQSDLGPAIERLIEEKRTIEDRVDVLHTHVLQPPREIDRLSLKETSLDDEVTSLKSFVEEVEDDRKLWMKVSKERLADVERLKVELEHMGRIQLSTRRDNNNAQEQISDLNSLLSQKLDEVDMLNKALKTVEEEGGRLNKGLKDVEEKKKTLTKTVLELDNQLQAFRAGAAEALKDLEGWHKRYQTESTHYRAEIASLRKELSAMKTLPGALLKERDSLHRDLEKAKFKMKDTEAKLKTTMQDKSKLETEKVNMDRELKHLRQSTLLQRDISQRDSIVDKRRQSIALVVNKTKNQLTSVEHALQLKMEEVENLTYELSQSHENYAKLEFAMAEAESYSNEKVAELEGSLTILKDEKDLGIATLEQIQNDVDAAKEQCKAKSNELESLKSELVTLTDKLQEREGEGVSATALMSAVVKEKEDIVEELLDAHISFQRQKADLIAQAQENREKCFILNQDIVLLTEELQKLEELQEEASDANMLLQNKLHQALETNTEKPVTHDKLLKELEAEVEFHKGQCRELQQHLESAQMQEYGLRMSGSVHLEQLSLELQQCTLKLSIARDEAQMLSMENQNLLVANTKLQFALDATRDKLEIFENRLDESDLELTKFKSLLQKAGFIRGDEWNLVSLQQFEKHIKAQRNDARRLETEIMSKKMEMRDLEVQFGSTRAQCQKYEEEIQYLKARVLTPEQETGVRKILQENKRLQAQLKKAEKKAQPWQELHELVKGKEVSMYALQTTVGSIHAQNAKLQKDLAASQAELESVHQLHKIAMRAGAIGKSLTSSSKPVKPGKLQAQATSQTSTPLSSNLSLNNCGPTFRAKLTCEESSEPGYRVPLGENSSNFSPCIIERKRSWLFPPSEKSKLSHSLGIGPRYFTPPESNSHLDLNKENLTLQ